MRAWTLTGISPAPTRLTGMISSRAARISSAESRSRWRGIRTATWTAGEAGRYAPLRSRSARPRASWGGSTPDLCQKFVDLWQADLAEWQDYLTKLLPFDSVASALDHLGLDYTAFSPYIR